MKRYNILLFSLFIGMGPIGSLFGELNPLALYREARHKNRQPNGIQLKSYQAQIKNNLIDGILSYAEENRQPFFFPESTEVTQIWQRGGRIFTRLIGKDAPPAVKEIVGNFPMVSGQVFFDQVYGESDGQAEKDIALLQRHSKAKLREDESKYYLTFSPLGEVIETNYKEVGLVKLQSSVLGLEVDILKDGLLITRLASKGEVKVTGAENYQKTVNIVVELEYIKEGELALVSKIHSYQLGSDEFDYKLTYTYTQKDGFYLPEKIVSHQTSNLNGEKKEMDVLTTFGDYQINQPFTPRAEAEYQEYEEIQDKMNE